MKKLFTAICIIFLVQITFAQSITPQVIASVGDYFTSTNYTLSWTLGEPIIETFEGTNNKLTQGFQQPNYNIVGIEDKSPLSEYVNINVYPNPATDYINIEWSKINSTSVNIILFDLYGRVLINENIKSSLNNYKIDFQNYARSSYLLRFITTTNTGEKVVKSFKIIKTLYIDIS